MNPTAKLALSAAAVLATLAAPFALAAPGGGGGGMGGGSMPSGSSENPAAAYQAGVAALQAQEYREAIRQFRTARRAAPNDGVVNYALGLAYAGNEDTDDARQSFERAVRADNCRSSRSS